jgi:glycosyltransferase involved in cell wall biosynthesis
MKLLISTPIRFQMTPDGSVWARQDADGYAFWTRYLAAFECVTLLARVRPVAAPSAGWVRADGEKVTNAAVPDYVGPFQLMRNWFPVRRAVRSAVGSADAIILRLPCNIGALVWWSVANGHPYGVEVVADPEAALSPGSIEAHLLPVWRRLLPFYLRKICLGATAAAYVTRYALQRLYPPNRNIFATSYSDVMTTHYSSTKLRRSLITDASRAYAADQKAYRVITVGAMDMLYKAQEILIKACALCVQRGLDLRLTLVGEGKMRGGLEILAAELGMADRTTFTGQLTTEQQITDALDKADLFALPSRAEGLPRAMIEAMARGLPCIGTNIGGIPELISSDCLVAPNDAPALAAKIHEVLTDPARMARLSKENLDRVADYTEEVLRSRRQSFYNHVVSETARWNSRKLAPSNDCSRKADAKAKVSSAAADGGM